MIIASMRLAILVFLNMVSRTKAQSSKITVFLHLTVSVRNPVYGTTLICKICILILQLNYFFSETVS